MTSAGNSPPAGSQLQEALRSGRFVVTAEVAPPRGASLEDFRATARALRPLIDAGNVTDGQGAAVRVASWAGALALLQEGLEPVLQLTCRDRNRIALQSELLAAGAMGIPNVLLLTGDHPRFGDEPHARPVFDLDSVQALWAARRLRDEGRLLSGRRVPAAPRWFLGAVENPYAAPQQFRALRLAKKVAAGAQFIQTQFVFDVSRFRRFMQQVCDLGLDRRCFVLAGVGCVSSLRALERIRHLPGLYVPEEVVRRLQGVPPDCVAQEGLALCAETIQQLREIPGVGGVHLLAPGSAERIAALLHRAGLAARR